jgi:type IV pilus assembly protein PilM
MLGLVQNWFGPRSNPIGVDFGTDHLRLAQVQWEGTDWRLIAAAVADVPASVRKNTAARLEFLIQTTRDMLAQGEFHGRSAVLGLPAANMHIQHLRLAKMDEDQLKKTLPWEARGKLPIDSSQAVLRHIVAGDVYVDQEVRQEVIVMAAQRESVDQFIAAAAKARLDIVGMNVEPMALLDCFTHVYRRQSDATVTNFLVDIGATGTRAILTRGRGILFARNIGIGGDQFSAAVAEALRISADDAKAMRIRLCQRHHARPTTDRAAIADAPEDPAQKQIEEACRPLLAKMVQELDLCRRYYEATFPSKPVDRLVFVGGEARHRWLCQEIARQLGLAAQLGDPLCRMNRQRCPAAIDRRQPQPSWAVAFGLSMGSPVQTAGAQDVPTETRSSSERA